MEIKINKQVFYEMLTKIQTIITKKSSMKILSNILLQAEGDILTLSASNLQESIITSNKCEVIVPGSVCVNGKTVFDIVSSCSKDYEIILKVEGNGVTIQSGKANFSVFFSPSEEFPRIEYKMDNDTSFTIESSKLQKMILETDFSASTDLTRPNLSGIYFKEGTNKLLMVSTDGHRMSLSSVDIVEPTKNSILKEGIIIPLRGIFELKRMLPKNEQTLTVNISKRNISVDLGNTKLMITLVDAVFPDYKSVIPQENYNAIVLNRTALIGIIKRVAVLSSVKNNGIILKICETKLEINTNNPDCGKASEELDIEFKGNPTALSVNAQFVLDALGVLDTNEITLNIGESEFSALLIKPQSESKTSFIIMPIRM